MNPAEPALWLAFGAVLIGMYFWLGPRVSAWGTPCRWLARLPLWIGVALLLVGFVGVMSRIGVVPE
jgi:hypothetical protein